MIYAAGDVASRYKFTHAADFMARIVIQNTLFRGRAKASALTIPWCTYTSPELAHVGLTAAAAERQGVSIDTYTQELSGVDRAILDGTTDGFARVHVRKGTDRIVGGTIVAAVIARVGQPPFSAAQQHRLQPSPFGTCPCVRLR